MSCTSMQPQRLEERVVRRRVRRQVHRAVAQPVERCDARGLAGDERVRRHARGELAVEAEHELVGLILGRQEARHVHAVHLVGARLRGFEAGPYSENAAGTHDPEQPRSVREQVAQRALRLRAPGREQPRREGIRGDEVPVAPRPRLGDGVVRLLARAEAHRQEERAVRRAAAASGRTARRSAGAEPGGDTLGALRVARIPGVPPGRGDREQPLPGNRLGVQAVDRGLDVGGELLGLEEPAPAAGGARARSRSRRATASRR